MHHNVTYYSTRVNRVNTCVFIIKILPPIGEKAITASHTTPTYQR